jgi:hypothetical protein
MRVKYTDGRTVAAVILALSGPIMRVALKDTDDVAEYQLVNGSWITDDWETVTFEFPFGVFEAIGMMPGQMVWPTQ